jgi:predicted N-acetyltransferase YhbS
MRKYLSEAIEVAASAAVVIGAAMFYAPLGWIAGGALGLWFAKGLAE